VVKIKITDFGLSKLVIPGELMKESCGTPAYVAPEVLNKMGYSKEIDIWSAGVIMYALVCRQLPFSADDRKETFRLIKEEEPDMALPPFSRFSKETKELLWKMLRKKPEKRITTEDALKHPFFERNGFTKYIETK
jgi:serine/threonine protein kinase